LSDAAARAWEAEERAAGMERERDDALAGRDAAADAAADESAQRGVAWDMVEWCELDPVSPRVEPRLTPG
jgi:hypothetical protein